MNYFVQNKLFSTKQFGFIKGRSTVLQLLKILDQWTELLDEGGHIEAIYTDFEKAFDKVPHKRLLSKLRSYGVRLNRKCNRVSMRKFDDSISTGDCSHVSQMHATCSEV